MVNNFFKYYMTEKITKVRAFKLHYHENDFKKSNPKNNI